MRNALKTCNINNLNPATGNIISTCEVAATIIRVLLACFNYKIRILGFYPQAKTEVANNGSSVFASLHTDPPKISLD